MKKILLLGLALVIAKVAFDRVTVHSAEKVDDNMTRIAAEINGTLPYTTDAYRVDQVEYANRMLRYSGILLGEQALTEAVKVTTSNQLKRHYCSRKVFQTHQIGVEYSFRKAVLKGMNDKVSMDTWSTTVRPQDCV